MYTNHNHVNHSWDIGGDGVHTETYCLFVGPNRDETNWVAGGRYIDRLERREGAWKIALRTNAIEWSGMVPTMPIPFAGVPDINVNGAPSRSKVDPSYRRPLTNRRKAHIPPIVSSCTRCGHGAPRLQSPKRSRTQMPSMPG